MVFIFYTKMKKAFFLIGTLTAIISIQPVFAVNYAACREMLRTKQQMLIKAHEAEGLFYRNLWDKSCPDEKFQNNFDKWKLCAIEAYMLYTDTHKPLLHLKTGIFIGCDVRIPCERKPSSIFYDPDAVSWIKSAIQVMLDMKKTSCPDE